MDTIHIPITDSDAGRKKAFSKKRMHGILPFKLGRLTGTIVMQLILLCLVANVSPLLAQDQATSQYIEGRGARDATYLIIHALEKPGHYVIGKSRFLIVEVLGILLIAGAISFGIFHGLGRYIVHKRNPKNIELVGQEFIYHIVIRLGHWVNALAVLVLIGTGFWMHYMGPSHRLGLIHNSFGMLFFVCNGLFILYELATFDFRQFVVEDWELKEGIFKQAMFYAIGIFKQEEHPYHMKQRHRLNPLQKMAYFSVMFFLAPFVGFTGITLLLPKVMEFFVIFIGLENMKYVFILHTLSAFAMVSYLLGHIYLATTGDTIKQHFEVMITGYHKIYTYVRNNKKA